MTENEQLQYNDALVDLAGILSKYGCDRVASDFQINFPMAFLDLRKSMNKQPEKPLAALLRK